MSLDKTAANSRTAFPDCVPALRDGTIAVRAHQIRDIPFIVEQCNDPVSKMYVPLPTPYGEAEAKSFISEFVAAGWNDNRRYEFAIEEMVDGTPQYRGSVGIWPKGDDRFELGFIMHPAARRRGIVTRAARLVLEWAFETHNARVVQWMAVASNQGSAGVARRLGFSEPVVLPNWLPINGQLHDCAMATLTREHFLDRR